jgi:hypothetical protein
MWQTLETKARFIAQVITGDNAVRSAQDIGGQELSYAEVKAIASGNPAVLTLAEADAETLQPPVVDLDTLASVVAAALLPSVGMAVSSAETGKAG